MSGIRVTARFFAAAKAAVGAPERTIELPDAATVADLIAEVAPTDPARGVLERCSFLVDGVAHADQATPLPDGATVDLLPPFAGG